MIKAYWYNMPSAGQRLRSVMGEIEAYSSWHVYVSDATLPATLRIEALDEHGGILYAQVALINEAADPEDDQGCHARLRGEALHVWARTETLPDNPYALRVHIQMNQGASITEDIPCTYHRIRGRVTTFDGEPFRAFICVYPDGFEHTGVASWCEEDGSYSLVLPERNYSAIWVDDHTYAINTLEAWGWHTVLAGDQRADWQVGTGEIYGLKAWPNRGGFPTYFALFRPMYLWSNGPPHLRREPMSAPEPVETVVGGRVFRVTELAPDLGPEAVSVTVNGQDAEVLSLERILEVGPDGAGMWAYLAQISRKGLVRQAGVNTLVLTYRAPVAPEGHLYEVRAMARYQWTEGADGFEA